MASFINFGGFDPSPQNYLARQQFRDKQARQLGQDIGSIASGFLKMRQDEINRQKEEQYEEDEKLARQLFGEKGLFNVTPEQVKKELVENKRKELEDLRRGQLDYEKYQKDEAAKAKLLQAELDRRKASYPIHGAPDVIPTADPNEEPMRYTGTIAPMSEDVSDEEVASLVRDEELIIDPDEISKARESKLKEFYGNDNLTLDQYERLQQTWRPGMTRSEELYRKSQLLRPSNPKRADELEEQSFKMYTLEQQLGVKEAMAKEKAAAAAPEKVLTKINARYSNLQRENEQIFAQYNTLPPEQKLSNVGKNKLKRIEENTIALDNLAEKGAELTKGTMFEGIYKKRLTDTDTGTDTGTNTGTDAGTDTGTNTGTNTGTDAGTDTGTDANVVTGKKEFKTPTLTSSSKSALMEAKQKVDQMVEQGLNPAKAAMMKTDLEIKQQKLIEKEKPKQTAISEWNSIQKSSAYIKARQDYRKIKNARTELEEAIKDPNLTVARAKQLAFKIARVVTGPGTLTESEVVNTQNRSLVEESLKQIGMEWLLTGSERSIENTRSGMEAALAGHSGYNTAVDNLNDFIIPYNKQYGKYNEQKLFKRLGGSGKDKKPEEKESTGISAEDQALLDEYF